MCFVAHMYEGYMHEHSGMWKMIKSHKIQFRKFQSRMRVWGNSDDKIFFLDFSREILQMLLRGSFWYFLIFFRNFKHAMPSRTCEHSVRKLNPWDREFPWMIKVSWVESTTERKILIHHFSQFTLLCCVCNFIFFFIIHL